MKALYNPRNSLGKLISDKIITERKTPRNFAIESQISVATVYNMIRNPFYKPNKTTTEKLIRNVGLTEEICKNCHPIQ